MCCCPLPNGTPRPSVPATNAGAPNPLRRVRRYLGCRSYKTGAEMNDPVAGASWLNDPVAVGAQVKLLYDCVHEALTTRHIVRTSILIVVPIFIPMTGP